MQFSLREMQFSLILWRYVTLWGTLQKQAELGISQN